METALETSLDRRSSADSVGSPLNTEKRVRGKNGWLAWAFGVTIFLSAFLLFQVQLLLGKQILPRFGGAPSVWTACLLTFQLLLLAGYAYAHGAASHLTARGQAAVHNAILLISLALLTWHLFFWRTPITPGVARQPSATVDPTLSILIFLVTAIGLPFFVLSTTGPLLQHWSALAWPNGSPYRLYAVSNAGSLLGLLSYPFLVEPHLHLTTQAWVWVAGYMTFGAGAVLTGALANRAHRESGRAIAKPEKPAGSNDWKTGSVQIALAGCASVLLLASTNLICQELTVIPFLWVLPLSLYLVSFILCFESDRWYRRRWFHPLFALSLGVVLWISVPNSGHFLPVQVAAYCGFLFSACMVCHGEAALTRPAAAWLTGFYLRIALGGALGGIFVSLVAPRIFPNYWEYPLGVLGCIALLMKLVQRDRTSWWYTGGPSLALLVLAGVALLGPGVLKPVWKRAGQVTPLEGFSVAVALALAAVIWWGTSRNRSSRPAAVRATLRIALALAAAGLAIPQKAQFYHVLARSRNFYGVLSVVEADRGEYFALRHGKTLHGFQYQDAARSHLATGYYGRNSGANIVIRNWPNHPMRVGLVGMGVGTLAALGERGDVYRFYEINPGVYRWSSGARPFFTYLRDSSAKIEVVAGDARVTLQREAAQGDFQKFDVLVLDAFSSDAIPMHLLTREAFILYERHLRGPRSVIAVHISNQTLNLRPVLTGIAQEFGFHACRVYPLIPAGPFSQSDWILFSRDAVSLSGAELRQKALAFPDGEKPIFWTDDYSDLFHILRWRD